MGEYQILYFKMALIYRYANKMPRMKRPLLIVRECAMGFILLSRDDTPNHQCPSVLSFWKGFSLLFFGSKTCECIHHIFPVSLHEITVKSPLTAILAESLCSVSRHRDKHLYWIYCSVWQIEFHISLLLLEFLLICIFFKCKFLFLSVLTDLLYLLPFMFWGFILISLQALAWNKHYI